MMFGTDCNWARCGQAPVINAPDWRIYDGPSTPPRLGPFSNIKSWSSWTADQPTLRFSADSFPRFATTS